MGTFVICSWLGKLLFFPFLSHQPIIESCHENTKKYTLKKNGRKGCLLFGEKIEYHCYDTENHCVDDGYQSIK